jgi:hypothetical protein
MSIKLRLAQWLAPEVFRSRDNWKAVSQHWQGAADRWSVKAVQRGFTLRKIASQRTPHANATVNRMADMAEAELKGEG